MADVISFADAIARYPQLKGPAGPGTSLRRSGGFVQAKRDDQAEWTNLLPLSDITGAGGSKGTDGRDGINGRDGAKGRDGFDGRDGIDGRDGAPGEDAGLHDFGRPGDGPRYFTADGTAREPEAYAQLDPRGVVDTPFGRAYEIKQAGQILTRKYRPIEQSRIYRDRVSFYRPTPPVDPDGDAVQVLLYCYGGARTRIATILLKEWASDQIPVGVPVEFVVYVAAWASTAPDAPEGVKILPASTRSTQLVFRAYGGQQATRVLTLQDGDAPEGFAGANDEVTSAVARSLANATRSEDAAGRAETARDEAVAATSIPHGPSTERVRGQPMGLYRDDDLRALLVYDTLAAGWRLVDGRGAPLLLAPGDVAVTQMPARLVAQRLSRTGGLYGKGTGSHRITVNPGKIVHRVEWRTRDAEAAGAPVLQDWTEIPDLRRLLPGAQTLTVPGVSARRGWHFLDLRFNGTLVVSGANRVGMGAVIGLAGQSLAVRLLKRIGAAGTMASLGVSPSPYCALRASYIDSTSYTAPTWGLAADGGVYDSCFAGEFGRLMVEQAGVNIGIVGHTRGSQSIRAFIPGGTEYAALMAAIDQGGGALEAFLWLQGHSDARTGMSLADYLAGLDTLFAEISARSSTPYVKALATIPNLSSTSWGDTRDVTTIRSAAAAWCTAHGGIHVQPLDIQLYDGVHQAPPGSIRLAQHFYRALRPTVAGLPHDDTGPRIVAATRVQGSPREIRLAIDSAVEGAGLAAVGSPARRFDVYPEGMLSEALALDANTPISLSDTQITLHLADDPDPSEGLDVWVGAAPDPLNDGSLDMIHDTVTDGDGIAFGRNLAPTLGPLTAASPVVRRLVTTAAVYEPSPVSAWGSRLKSGYGVAAAPMVPLAATWTIEGRISLPRAPRSVKVAMGAAAKAWIGANAAGRLVACYTGSEGDVYVGTSTNGVAGDNPVISDGVERHVALVASLGGAALYLDGVLVASSAIAPTTADVRVFAIAALGSTTINSSFSWPGTVDEVAVWQAARYPGAFTPPSAPYAGSEPDLAGLWHLDDNDGPARLRLALSAPTFEDSPNAVWGQRLAGGYGTVDNPLAVVGSVWTIEARITLARITGGSPRVIAGVASGCWIGCNRQGRAIGCYRGADGTDKFVGSSSNAAEGSNPRLADGAEHHVALVASSSGVTLFVDGVAVGTNAAAPAENTAPVFGVSALGNTSINPAFLWPGTVEEVAVWRTDRYGSAFAVPTDPYSGSEVDLVALWHLNGNGGSSNSA